MPAGAGFAGGHGYYRSVPLLDDVHDPRDLRSLSTKDAERLAAQIRAFLIRSVSKTGGHLGPNLGVVELTLALHRTFDSPHDPIVFDTGHQSYVHKILTGRRDGRTVPATAASCSITGSRSAASRLSLAR